MVNTHEEDDFADNNLRESFQIDVGRGDAIPGISPHIGRVGLGYTPVKDWNITFDIETQSDQFYRGDENNSANQKVPGYYLLNISTEYTLDTDVKGSPDLTFFLQARNILNENYETGGIYAENEVEGTGNSGTFVTPGQPFSIFAGFHAVW